MEKKTPKLPYRIWRSNSGDGGTRPPDPLHEILITDDQLATPRKRKRQTPCRIRRFRWWRWGDSNPRPLTCEATRPVRQKLALSGFSACYAAFSPLLSPWKDRIMPGDLDLENATPRRTRKTTSGSGFPRLRLRTYRLVTALRARRNRAMNPLPRARCRRCSDSRATRLIEARSYWEAW